MRPIQRRVNSNECLACTLNPILLPGRLLGFMPVKPICKHLYKTATATKFIKSNTSKYLRSLWIFLMTATSLCYVWLVLQSTGPRKLETLSEALNCWNSTHVLLCTFFQTHVFVLELNGLSEIIRNTGSTRLLTAQTTRWIRRFCIRLEVVIYALFVVQLATAATSMEFDMNGVLNLIGVDVGQICFFAIISQIWTKIFLMKKIFKTFHMEIRQALVWKIAPNLESEIQKVSKLQMSIVRNYEECSRFLSPGMVIGQLIILGNLIVAFYTMVRTCSNTSGYYKINTQLEVRTYILIVDMIAMYASQQRLEDVVSN